MARLHADLTDLMWYFERNRAPLGVPRVQMALIEAALDPPARLLEPIAFHAPSGRMRPLPEAPLRALLHQARAGTSIADPAWQEARAALLAAQGEAAEPGFSPGDVVATLGLAVQVPGQMRRLRELRRAHGVALAALFHDAIPLMVPEHCGAELVEQFTQGFLALCLQVDHVVATSQCVARDFRTWQRRLLPALDIPVSTMPLDAPLPPMEGEAPALPSPLDDGRPYVLCVSTIEARKNHTLLLGAWLTLLRRHGAQAMPRLVLAGRAGYGAEPALRLLRDAPELRAHAVWLEGVSDALLARLYRECLFTVFNSHYEGWGLPVTEALSHGKLVLCPDHSSLREAGGSAALYYTPQSEPELADLAWGLIRDPKRRAALEAALPERLRLRSWREVAEGFAAALQGASAALPTPLGRAGELRGRRVSFAAPETHGPDSLPGPAALAHHLVMEGEGWSVQEEWGVWLTDAPARLRLPAIADKAMRLFLEVVAPPAAAEVALRAASPGRAAGEWQALGLAPGERRIVELRLPAGPAGDVVLEFDTSGAVMPPGETRRLALGLTGLMLAADSDHWAIETYLGERLRVRMIEG
jgi:glycosyltransferase involved in cell wall biosynthesis